MDIEKLKTIKSTNKAVANAIAACVNKACGQAVKNDGTGEGAAKQECGATCV